MSMSKKDYEVIGAIVRTSYNAARAIGNGLDATKVLDDMADSMADAFKRDNVRFQKDRFLEAATPDWHRAARGLPPMKRTVARVHAQRPMPEGF